MQDGKLIYRNVNVLEEWKNKCFKKLGLDYNRLDTYSNTLINDKIAPFQTKTRLHSSYIKIALLLNILLNDIIN